MIKYLFMWWCLEDKFYVYCIFWGELREKIKKWNYVCYCVYSVK